jgi:chromosome partitioning protein
VTVALVVTVAGLKGGVGKTTTAVNLAASLVALDHRVVLVDTDPQASASLSLGVAPYASPRPHVTEVLMERMGRSLYVVPGGRGLAGAHNNEEHLALGRKAAGKDGVVVVDTPPIFSAALIETLRASLFCIAPLEPTPLSLPSLRELSALIGRMETGPFLRALLVRVQARRLLTEDVVALLAQEFPGVVYSEPRIPEDARAAEAPGHALPLEEFAPKSKAQEAYRSFARLFIEEMSHGPEATKEARL